MFGAVKVRTGKRVVCGDSSGASNREGNETKHSNEKYETHSADGWSSPAMAKRLLTFIHVYERAHLWA